MKKSGKRIIYLAFSLLICLLFVMVVYQVHRSLRTAETIERPWNLCLVNRDYAVPAGYHPPLLTLSNGQKVDERIYPDLQAMFDAARQEGLDLHVASGYRTKQQQKEILYARIKEYRKQGYGTKQATAEAESYVALPDHSEHQLGLAIDIQIKGNTNADALYRWLEIHAHEYGFIQRYPKEKTDITGFSYERWHYRYVGKEAAKTIFQSDLTLEEYLLH